MGMKAHPVSARLLTWLQGMSGCLTRINSDDESVQEMMEHNDWDQSTTENAFRLLQTVREHLEKVEVELSDHVNTKFG